MAQQLRNLPVGAKIKYGKHSINGETAQPIVWIIADKQNENTMGCTTLITEKIIDLRAYDGAETNVPGSSGTIGNNNYGLSNIDAWLNSSEQIWYMPKHVYDVPPNNTNTQYGTGYDARPGFLSNFSEAEIGEIYPTLIDVTKYGGTVESLDRKIFLPSFSELGLSVSGEPNNGTTWSYFLSNPRSAVLTSQCFNNTLSALKPSDTNTVWSYWLRSASSTSAGIVYYLSIDSTGQTAPHFGYMGIRPAMNLIDVTVSDTTDSDGCYTVTLNSAPPIPTTLNVPTLYGGRPATISWGSVTDPDGDEVRYELDMIVDGVRSNVYSGTSLSYTTIIPSGVNSVEFILTARDSFGASEGFINTTKTVINNTAPVISGSDSNLGTKSDGFTQTYTITDVDNDTVTVVESIDGVQLRSYVATLGATNTFSVVGNTWVGLSNGSHTLTISVSDGRDVSTRTYTFIKSVSSLTISNSSAIESTTRPTRIKVTVSKNIPPEATFLVEVCNNGFDSSPTWEDATSSVTSSLVHVFTNTTKTATNWGVRIRVTVNRNGGSGECYIGAVGGNFE